MTWTVRLSRDAARQLRRLPQDQQALIRERLHEMRDDPFRGDVIPLKGRRWQGRYRKRVGRYRIIFAPNHAEHIVEISAILLRDEQTYR
jgi:mRNA-degrading endonuclease RelE of RelBE toxin-antitoxin system